jgi:hypothetical protein
MFNDDDHKNAIFRPALGSEDGTDVVNLIDWLLGKQGA